MDFRYYNCMYCYTSQSQGGFFSQDPNGVWKLRKNSAVARAGKVGRVVVKGVSVDFATAKILGSGEAGEAGDFLAPPKKQGV